MIMVTRLNQAPFMVNADLIKTVEATPDTVVTLYNDEKFIVRETVDEIVARVVAFRRSLYAGLFSQQPETVARQYTPQQS
jgi:flagellar protein FlbD